MHAVYEERICCPYCGESIDILIDSSEAGHSYIEDCQVCCRPIVMSVELSADGEATVRVSSEDES